MAALGPNHTICTCVALGCSERQFVKHGQTLTGRLFHQTNYPRHLQESIDHATTVQQIEPPDTTNASTLFPANPPVTESVPSHNLSTTTGTRKRPRSPEPLPTTSRFSVTVERPLKKIHDSPNLHHHTSWHWTLKSSIRLVYCFNIPHVFNP